jgi:hypothetical protein
LQHHYSKKLPIVEKTTEEEVSHGIASFNVGGVRNFMHHYLLVNCLKPGHRQYVAQQERCGQALA